MADVARESRISSSLLFRYFRSRSALLAAIVKRSDEQRRWLLDAIVKAARTSNTCTELLVGVGRAYADYIQKTHHYFVLWFMNKDLMPARTRKLFDRLYPALAKSLAAMPDYRRNVKPEVVIRAFLGAIFSVVFLYERIGAEPLNGLSFDDFLAFVAQYVGTFLTTSD